jgi:hypothetical protein
MVHGVMAAIELTGYARFQMSERELPESLVLDALKDADEIVAGDKGRKVAHKRLPQDRNHLLRVVFEEHGDRVVVVTAYVTSKVDKYWRGQ